MMRRRRYARVPPVSGAAGSDTDALQTDVMRFMSIIGLCLMAVFALVQGLPVQEQGKPVQPPPAARIRQDIKAQQQQLQELQAELDVLKAERDRTQQVLTVAQQHLEQLAGQTQQASAARDRLEVQLENLDRQLAQGRKELTAIEQAAVQKQQTLAELGGRLSSTQVQLDHNRQEIAALKPPLPQKIARPVIENQAPPDPVPQPVAAKQGFSLRFVSDDALDRLVAAGSVTLYAMVNQQAWQLSLEAGRPATAQTPFPGWFHEMAMATVPAHYIHSLENMVHGPGQSTVVWGVQLPAATKAAITALMQGQQGGALVIRGNGQVRLEE